MHQVPFKKTHDLDELKQSCLPLATGAADQLATIERLSQYAWRFRYPGAPYSPELTEAEEARHATGELLQAMAAQLEPQFGERDSQAIANSEPLGNAPDLPKD